jgi:hypothetical protein
MIYVEKRSLFEVQCHLTRMSRAPIPNITVSTLDPEADMIKMRNRSEVHSLLAASVEMPSYSLASCGPAKSQLGRLFLFREHLPQVLYFGDSGAIDTHGKTWSDMPYKSAALWPSKLIIHRCATKEASNELRLKCDTMDFERC